MEPVRGLGFEAAVALYRDTLGLAPFREEPGRLAWFRRGEGTELHVYGPGRHRPRADRRTA